MEGELSNAEPQLHANGWESVFEKMPFLTLLNKNVWSLSYKNAFGHKVFSKNSEFISPYIHSIINKDPVHSIIASCYVE